MPHTVTAIREFPPSEAEAFRREMALGERPAVLRGLACDWPAVIAGRSSAAALLAYLQRFDNGRAVDAIMTPPEVHGRIFYSEGLKAFNFLRNQLPVSAIGAQLLRYSGFANPPALAAQSALIDECLPGFAEQNRCALLDERVRPRLWLGSAITTPTHLDEWGNVGCVILGRRRFTLFPPEQVANLYIGPLDFAPTGAPVSLVPLHDPNPARFPRFARALAASVSAELHAGDAIFIPPLWWHHVESLDPINMLINYWWHGLEGAQVGEVSGFDALALALLNLRPLQPATRAAWQALFTHFVFASDEEVTAHIPPERHGILAPSPAAHATRRRAQLAQRLTGKPGVSDAG